MFLEHAHPTFLTTYLAVLVLISNSVFANVFDGDLVWHFLWKGTSNLSYSDVSYTTFFTSSSPSLRKLAPFARIVTDVFLCITMLGICCIYFVFISQNIEQVNFVLLNDWLIKENNLHLTLTSPSEKLQLHRFFAFF